MSAAAPLFSIVIPTFNRAKLIETAINSVIEQTFTDWELIVVDDGSTDETQTVVAPYLKDARIRYHFQENKELNGARNTGIELAHGTYVCFLDDDDYYLENHLGVMAGFIEKKDTPVGLIRTGTYYKRGKKMDELPNFTNQHAPPFEFIWKNPVNLLSIAIHRQVFDSQRFAENFLLYEDVHFLFRVILDFPFFQIPDYTVIYVNHDQARTLNYRDESKVASYFNCMNHLFEHFGERLAVHISPKMRREAVSLQYLNFANAAIKSEDYSIVWKYIRQALKKGAFWSILRSYVYTIGLYFARRLFGYGRD
jgi:glycosyltransferase involved in cell wall biosynthesis